MASLNKTAELDSLTRKQLERYHYLYPLFGDESVTIVKLLAGGRGRNSWSAFQEKLNIILNASLINKQYFNSLYDVFDIGEEYPMDTIIQEISSVRSELKLPSYGDQIKHNCENDFLGLFIAENVYAQADSSALFVRRKVLGYKPIFKIQPE